MLRNFVAAIGLVSLFGSAVCAAAAADQVEQSFVGPFVITEFQGARIITTPSNGKYLTYSKGSIVMQIRRDEGSDYIVTRNTKGDQRSTSIVRLQRQNGHYSKLLEVKAYHETLPVWFNREEGEDDLANLIEDEDKGKACRKTILDRLNSFSSLLNKKTEEATTLRCEDGKVVGGTALLENELLGGNSVFYKCLRDEKKFGQLFSKDNAELALPLQQALDFYRSFSGNNPSNKISVTCKEGHEDKKCAFDPKSRSLILFSPNHRDIKWANKDFNAGRVATFHELLHGGLGVDHNADSFSKIEKICKDADASGNGITLETFKSKIESEAKELDKNFVTTIETQSQRPENQRLVVVGDSDFGNPIASAQGDVQETAPIAPLFSKLESLSNLVMPTIAVAAPILGSGNTVGRNNSNSSATPLVSSNSGSSPVLGSARSLAVTANTGANSNRSKDAADTSKITTAGTNLTPSENVQVKRNSTSQADLNTSQQLPPSNDSDKNEVKRIVNLFLSTEKLTITGISRSRITSLTAKELKDLGIQLITPNETIGEKNKPQLILIDNGTALRKR